MLLKDDLASYNQLYVGFSGGLDSTVLLHGLVQDLSLRDKLIAVHINHGLSPNAQEWQASCEQWCFEYGVKYLAYTVEFDKTCNIEENARNARYEIFASLIKHNDALLVAHHADDQAETVLLQLMRGSGIDGLAAMQYKTKFADGVLLRPLLDKTRLILETYATTHQLRFIHDESNQNIAFARNYIRHQIMPTLRAKWPSVVSNIVSCSEHCQQAQTNLQTLAQIDCEQLDQDTLSCMLLKDLAYPRLVNVLRAWLKNKAVKMPTTKQLNDIITTVIYARQDATPCVRWNNVVLYRYQQQLYLLPNAITTKSINTTWELFPQDLILADGRVLSAKLAPFGIQIPNGSEMKIMYRQGGEKFRWHGQTKLLKNLLQEWKVPPWLRDSLPLIYINNKLAAVVGYAISDEFYGDGGYVIISLPMLF